MQNETPVPCTRCGEPHIDYRGKPGCTGHISSGPTAGDACKGHRVFGTTVCRSHGAGNAATKAKYIREQELAAAQAAVRTLGLPVDISPTEALLEEVRWTAGHVQWLRAKVQELDDQDSVANRLIGTDSLVGGTTRVIEKGSGPNPGTDEVWESTPSVWYTLYSSERDRLITVCSAALRAGVEERRVRLAESQGDLVAQVIRRILDDLQLSVEQQTAVATVVPRHLRALAGGAA